MTFAIDAHAGGFSPSRLARITDHLERRYIQPGKIAGCQTLVARHGHVGYHSTLGHMDVESQTAMRDDALFRIYSMTKPITSVALMTLFERGEFQLNDPVSRFIPSWKQHKVWVSGDIDNMELVDPVRPMTVRDLLSHTSGLTYGSLLGNIGIAVDMHPVDSMYDRLQIRRSPTETLADFVEQLANVPLRFHPGTQWMYSLATDVCAYLVEAISGRPFDQYLQEAIFEPLGMTDTGFHVDADEVARFTSNYGRRKDKSLIRLDTPATSEYLKQPSFLSGGGGLVSTMSDYFKFTEMLRRGGELGGQRILSSRTIDLMRMNHLAGGQDLTQMAIGAFSETAYQGIGFGLGFASTIDQAITGALGTADYYWGGAASTIFWVDPVEDLVVIFLTQLMPSNIYDFRGQLKSLVYSAIES